MNLYLKTKSEQVNDQTFVAPRRNGPIRTTWPHSISILQELFGPHKLIKPRARTHSHAARNSCSLIAQRKEKPETLLLGKEWNISRPNEERVHFTCPPFPSPPALVWSLPPFLSPSLVSGFVNRQNSQRAFSGFASTWQRWNDCRLSLSL